MLDDFHRVLKEMVMIIMMMMIMLRTFNTGVNVNPIQTGLFWPSLDWGVASNVPSPLRFLKTIKDKIGNFQNIFIICKFSTK